MKYSIGVEYAFHSLFYMVELSPNTSIGIRPLAQLHNISETYLSKIFTKLKKAGIVRSVTGVKGGYALSRPADEITFWDIVQAVEGASHIFQCVEIRQNNILSDRQDPFLPDCPCTFKVVMMEAEEHMRKYLQSKTLSWLYAKTYSEFSKKKKQSITEWLNKNTSM